MNNQANSLKLHRRSESAFSARTWLLLFVLVSCGVFYYAVPLHSIYKPATPDALHSDSEDAQDALEQLISKMPADQAQTLLIRDTNDPSPGLRFAAVSELENYRNLASVNALQKSFSDSSSSVREAALYGVCKLDKMKGLRLLISGLRDSDSQIREDSALVLELWANPATVPSLINALADSDPSVVHLAIGGLHKCTGLPYTLKLRSPDSKRRIVIAEWRTWWTRAKSHWNGDKSLNSQPVLLPSRLDPAPNFAVDDLSNQPLSLAGQRGKITVLNFWATWCPECTEEVPWLKTLDQTYRGKDVSIIGIAVGEPDASTVQKWCSANGVLYRNALANNSMLDSYGDIQEVPVTVIIDQNSQIRDRWDGSTDYRTVQLAIQRLKNSH